MTSVLPQITSLDTALVILRRGGPGVHPLFLIHVQQTYGKNTGGITVQWATTPTACYWAKESATRVIAWLYQEGHVPKLEPLYVEPLILHLACVAEPEEKPFSERFDELVRNAPPMPQNITPEPATTEEAIEMLLNDPRTPVAPADLNQLFPSEK